MLLSEKLSMSTVTALESSCLIVLPKGHKGRFNRINFRQCQSEQFPKPAKPHAASLGTTTAQDSLMKIQANPTRI